jgi:hypothetical protein
VAGCALAGLAAAPAALGDAASEYAQLVLTSQPTAYYEFNDGEGPTSFPDASGNGNTASTDGGLPVVSPGPLGPTSTAADIANGSELLPPTLSPMQGDNDRTVEVWFKTTETNTCVIAADFGTPAIGGRFDVCLTDGNQPFSPTPGAPGVYVGLFSADVYLPDLILTDGNWHYIAVTITGSTETVDVDGQTPGGYSWDGSIYSPQEGQPFALPNQPNTNSNFTVGGGGVGYLTAAYTGEVAELAIYPSALPTFILNAHFHFSPVTETQTPPGGPGDGVGPSPIGDWGLSMTNGGGTPAGVQIDATFQVTGLTPPLAFNGKGQVLALLSRRLLIPLLVPEVARQTFFLAGRYTVAAAGCSTALPCVALSLDRFQIEANRPVTNVTLTGVAGCRAHLASCWSGTGSDYYGFKYQWIACRDCQARLVSHQLKRIFRVIAVQLGNMSHNDGVVSLVLGVPGLAIPPVGFLGLVAGAQSMTNGEQALNYALLAADPPDPNFEAIVVPVLPPRVRVARAVPAKLRRILQRWLDNARQEAAELHALRVALERAQGATAAHDGQWTLTQMVAAAQFAREGGSAMRREVTILRSLRRALKGTPRFNPHLSVAHVRRAVHYVRQHGLPSGVKHVLQRLGATKADLARLRSSLLKTPARQLSGSVFARVTSSARVSQLLRVATALQQYSATVAQHPVG